MIAGKKRFILIATSFSDPGTMGGNTKIAIETVRLFSEHTPVVVIIPSARLSTLTDNLSLNDRISVCTMEAYKRNTRLHPFAEAFFYFKQLKNLFAELNVSSSDFVFPSSDFLYDVLPIFLLKGRFHFTWITSNFLFVPSPLENLIKRYTFPFFLYILAYIYQRSIFYLIKWRGDLFVITNDCDRMYYPKKHQDRIFAFYGGVNLEQIEVVEKEPVHTRYDVIFCSRLHPQKGLNQFLDIWHLVVHKCPSAKLAIIGNGAPQYEQYLHRKADRLGISNNIEWLGYVNNEEKFRLYRASRFFVHSTVYDNNGMVAAEALCTGLRVIMNDLPSLKEIYTDGCIKSDFSNKMSTACLIADTLSNPTPYEMRETIVRKYREYWEWKNRVRLFEQFLTGSNPQYR